MGATVDKRVRKQSRPFDLRILSNRLTQFEQSTYAINRLMQKCIRLMHFRNISNIRHKRVSRNEAYPPLSTVSGITTIADLVSGNLPRQILVDSLRRVMKWKMNPDSCFVSFCKRIWKEWMIRLANRIKNVDSRIFEMIGDMTVSFFWACIKERAIMNIS